MASFLRNTFDNLVNNINSTLSSQNPSNQRGRAPPASSRTNPTTQPTHTSNRSGPFSRRRQPATDNRPNSQTSNSHNSFPSSGVHRPPPPRYYHHQQSDHRPFRESGTNAPPQATGRTNHYRSSRNQQNPQHNQRDNMATARTNAASTDNKLDIDDLNDPNDINNLNAKQLKIILTRNCVDFKGIFEKEVLREKVMQLWIDCNERKGRRQAQNQAKNTGQTLDEDIDDIDENQACKICMEKEINCVLLECGHMLTCVTCGRKLAECPICRQNITRVVRTFRG